MQTKQIIFKQAGTEEIIIARELTFAEYEEYTRILQDRNETNFHRQTINIMVRFAEDQQGIRKFSDSMPIDGMKAKEVLTTAYAFGYAIAELNTFTKEDTDAMVKN